MGAVRGVVFRGSVRRFHLLLMLAVLGGSFLHGADQPDLDSLAQEGLRILADYLRIDTTNPPGNEEAAARFFARILRKEDIPFRILESAPGRANLYARLRGSGGAPPLLLLQHMDVVPSDQDQWAVGPFSGELSQEALWGRGALDMKGLGVVHLMTFLAIQRSRLPLNRDVILLAAADEEAGGGLGVAWLMDNHFELLRGVGLVLAEGGTNVVVDGRPAYIGIEVSQKVPLWLRLSVKGQPGHGSTLHPESAPWRLIRALQKISNYGSPVRVEPSVARYFRRIARFQPPQQQQLFSGIRRVLEDRNLVGELGPYYGSLLQNTVNLTVLRAGEATNAVPAEAVAELDCRLLPSQDVDQFVSDLARLIDDPAVQIQRLLEFGPNASPEDSELFTAVEEVLATNDWAAEVGPSVLPGFTDSYHFRAAGIPAYGFTPFMAASGEGRGVHGENERITVPDFQQGLSLFYQVVERLVRSPQPRATASEN